MPLKPPEVTIGGARGEEIERIMGRRSFVVKSAIPCRAALPDRDDAEVYLLDVDVLTNAEFNTLAHHFADKFGGGLGEIKDAMREVGVPILAEDCYCAIDMRFLV